MTTDPTDDGGGYLNGPGGSAQSHSSPVNDAAAPHAKRARDGAGRTNPKRPSILHAGIAAAVLSARPAAPAPLSASPLASGAPQPTSLPQRLPPIGADYGYGDHSSESDPPNFSFFEHPTAPIGSDYVEPPAYAPTYTTEDEPADGDSPGNGSPPPLGADTVIEVYLNDAWTRMQLLKPADVPAQRAKQSMEGYPGDAAWRRSGWLALKRG